MGASLKRLKFDPRRLLKVALFVQWQASVWSSDPVRPVTGSMTG